MTRTLRLAGGPLLLALLVAPLFAADAAYSVKGVTAAPPKELKEAFAKLLGAQAVQLLDQKGDVVAELWLRQDIPTKAKAEQLKAGLAYRDIPETSFLGVVRFPRQITDYRQQRVKPGIYTLRLATIKMDGDHMGAATYPEFCLLIPIDRDAAPDPLKKPEELWAQSTKSTGTSHPGVFMLFPNAKPEDMPKVMNKGMGHWVVYTKTTGVADGQKAPLGFALTLIGHAAE